MASESLPALRHRRGDFPPGFLFGAATSSYQIEGHAAGGAGTTHWDTFAATPGNVVRAENGRVACDHYHRYGEDLDLLRDANFDAYRFSVSWARVLPHGTGQPNAAGLDFYDRLVDAMLERQLKPLATLYHWELPAPLSDLGGWRNRDIAGWFADYTEVVVGRLGDRLYSVAPINEPWCVAWLSHFLGHHAPGVRDIRAAARAMHHVGLAHGTAIGVMRSLGLGNLGAVLNFEHAAPVDESEAAAEAARRYDGIYNRWFAGGMLRAEYPADIVAALEPHLPANWQDDLPTVAAKLDWVGINYYTRKLVGAAPDAAWPHLSEHVGELPTTTMGWEIYPDGLAGFLARVNEAAPDLPILVTENGMSWTDSVTDGRVDDGQRIDFFNVHLDAVRAAIADGVPVVGYVAWSLLDNFEWSLGYEKRFGLVHVDFESLARTPKASWYAWRDALGASD